MAAPFVQAAQITGFVDDLSAHGVTGWACVPGSGQSVAVSVFAGAALLGTFPAHMDRPDLGPVCGGSTAHGFGIWFDPTMQAQFLGQTSLTVSASAPGLSPRTLPASNPSGKNPASMPSGGVSGFDQRGSLFGTLAFPGGTPPSVEIYSGGPATGGGTPWGQVALQRMGPYAAQFVASPALAATGPLFAYAADRSGALVPLLGVPPATSAASLSQTVPFGVAVAQSGNHSGITNTLFTSWIAEPENFGGLSGGITFSGNAPAFSEALVTLGTTPDLQPACTAKNGSWPATAPPLTRLWAAILKSTSGAGTPVTLPVDFALPLAKPLSANNQGACLAALVSAGYPYLDASAARYSHTTLGLTTWLTPNSQSDPGVFALGLGGEFKFMTGGAQPLATFVGIKASRALLVDGIAGAVSASAVAGAPAGSGWLPVPAGLWTVTTSFDYFPASLCARSGFIVQPSNGTYSIIRKATPALFTIPAGASDVFDLPLWGSGAVPIQLAAYKSFTNKLNRILPNLQLAAGDCLIAFQTMQPSSGQVPGAIDYENQSTVYIRLAQ